MASSFDAFSNDNNEVVGCSTHPFYDNSNLGYDLHLLLQCFDAYSFIVDKISKDPANDSLTVAFHGDRAFDSEDDDVLVCHTSGNHSFPPSPKCINYHPPDAHPDFASSSYPFWMLESDMKAYDVGDHGRIFATDNLILLPQNRCNRREGYILREWRQ